MRYMYKSLFWENDLKWMTINGTQFQRMSHICIAEINVSQLNNTGFVQYKDVEPAFTRITPTHRSF